MMRTKDDFIPRVRIVYTLVFLVGALLATRLFFIQVARGDYYREVANGQYISPSADYFDRGTINFTRKDGQLVSAATVKKGYLLAINPKRLKDPAEAFRRISSVVTVNKKDFMRRAAKKGDPYEEIAHRLNEEDADKIEKMKIPGVNVFSERWRFYPAGSLASRVLGFVGYRGNKLAGRYGLEKYYEGVLAREGEKKTNINFFAEIFAGIKEMVGAKSEEGDISLTIEPEVQGFLERTLERLREKYSPQMAGGVVIEPSTGKILAMAVKPDFNPNDYGETKDMSLFLNPIVQNVFEMGSIMKPLTLAASMDAGAITPETTYYDKGFIVLDGSRIENYEGKSEGRVDMQEVLSKSLNMGAIFAMRKMGKKKFLQYLESYGLGEKTGIDLPDEVKGKISNLRSGRDVEYATASFGQGIAVTPIAMASALASLANGGLLMRPHVVDEIDFDNAPDKKIEPVARRRVLKKETAEEISGMLVRAADESILRKKRRLEHYSVAVKTGTAQMHRENGKGYYKNEYLHSFFGYAPAFNAKFLVLLFLTKPRGVRYAVRSLSDPFMDIVKFMINYYGIEPDR